MNYDGKRVYSVHTREEIREKMMKEVVGISEVFSLSLSDATVILISQRWNSFKASDRLGDDKEKFLSGLGLFGSIKPSSSDEDLDEVTGEGDSNLVSTPFCSHKFSKDCWKDYLSKTLEKKEEERSVLLISCLSQDCVASVGPDTIEKLAEPVLKEMYDRYLVESFMESNKDSIRWCPDPVCDYAVEPHEDPSEDFDVVCSCGYRFCWSCQLKPHRPVTCNNASLWLNKLLDESRTLAWNAKRIKHCPKCDSLVKHRDGVWKCITCNASSPSNESALVRHLALWDASHAAMKKSKRDLEAIKEVTTDCGLGELDMKALREAWTQIVQCRSVLKWSFVFGYFITDYHSAKKEYLDHIRERATAQLVKHKQTLDEVTDRVISGGGDIIAFRQKLGDTTTTTGNYFHRFVKTLEDGLCDVKVDTYVNGTTDYWFCDRCTYKNYSFERECRICVGPCESPRHVALGQGGTNPLEFADE
ncbi:hypothetical protein Bca101_024403 [Brassica carinata]